MRGRWGPATRKRFPRFVSPLWAKLQAARFRDVRLALGSVAPIPLHLIETEQALTGKKIEPSLIDTARKSAVKEIRPIDDIRFYRTISGCRGGQSRRRVSREACRCGGERVSEVLARWNGLAAGGSCPRDSSLLQLENLGHEHGLEKADPR